MHRHWLCCCVISMTSVDQELINRYLWFDLDLDVTTQKLTALSVPQFVYWTKCHQPDSIIGVMMSSFRTTPTPVNTTFLLPTFIIKPCIWRFCGTVVATGAFVNVALFSFIGYPMHIVLSHLFQPYKCQSFRRYNMQSLAVYVTKISRLFYDKLDPRSFVNTDSTQSDSMGEGIRFTCHIGTVGKGIHLIS